MKIALELSTDEAELLTSAADRLGLRPEDLVRAAVAEFLGDAKEDFQRAAEHVLEKNAELYRRLR